MKIGILTPTRQRAIRRKEFHRSVIDLCSKDTEVTCYYYIDNDDPELDKYISETLDNCINIVGEPISVSRSWNILAAKAVKEGCEILIMGNDDLVYESENWDLKLKSEIEIYSDKIYCAWFNDGINGEKHCAFPIVSKEWYTCLDYFTPGVFNFGYNDTWIFDIAKKINRCHYIPKIKTQHKHFTVNKSSYDETYARNRTRDRGNLYTLDSKIYQETNELREKHAEKLRQYINDRL